MQEYIDVVRLQLISDERLKLEVPIRSPYAAVERFGKELKSYSREVLAALYLTSKQHVLAIHLVSMGTINQAMVSPAEILKPALLCNAGGVILMHNHPSGDITPSQEDKLVTNRMENACKLMGIDLVDHVIVGSNTEECFSFAERGLLKSRKTTLYLSEKKRGGRSR